MRLALTAGHRKSLHTIALIEGLARRGHQVDLVLEMPILDRNRLRAYVRQWGAKRVAAKVLARFGPRAGKGSAGGEVAPLLEHLRESSIAARTVAEAAAHVGARHVRVTALDGDGALTELRRCSPDYLVYAGGGILRPETLAIPRNGTLNAHGGPLPAFRGMNASEWALFEGVAPHVTVHLIDAGVDTGPVFTTRPVDVYDTDTIADIRGRAAVVGVETLLDVVDLLERSEISATPQDLTIGRQYHVMTEPLLDVLQRWISEGRTPEDGHLDDT